MSAAEGPPEVASWADAREVVVTVADAEAAPRDPMVDVDDDLRSAASSGNDGDSSQESDDDHPLAQRAMQL